MKAIYEYQLEIAGTQIIQMPKNAKILTIQEQVGIPTLWAFVNCAEEYESVTIITLLNGSIPVEYEDLHLEYIGTYQTSQYPFIGHVFVKREV